MCLTEKSLNGWVLISYGNCVCYRRDRELEGNSEQLRRLEEAERKLREEKEEEARRRQRQNEEKRAMKELLKREAEEEAAKVSNFLTHTMV